MNVSSKRVTICLICQDYVDHITSKCPKIKCKSCGVLGHAKKDCPSINVGSSASTSQTNESGK